MMSCLVCADLPRPHFPPLCHPRSLLRHRRPLPSKVHEPEDVKMAEAEEGKDAADKKEAEMKKLGVDASAITVGLHNNMTI